MATISLYAPSDVKDVYSPCLDTGIDTEEVGPGSITHLEHVELVSHIGIVRE